MLMFLLSGAVAKAQVCDNSTPPSNLTATLDPASGLLLEWDAVPGNVGVLVMVLDPDGESYKRRYLGSELDELLVPEARLMPGTYTWFVQATCSDVFPFDVTPVSDPASYTYAPGPSCPSTVVDVDGNVYGVAEIAGQCWTTSHLRTRHYQDGSPVTDGTGLASSAWTALSTDSLTGAYCYPDGDSLNEPLYGLLYNANAPNDARGLCPSGWHVPSTGAYTDLIDAFGGGTSAFDALANAPSDTPSWNGSNASGFSAQPAGLRSTGGGFGNIGTTNYIWTSTPGTFATSTGTILLSGSGSGGSVLIFTNGVQDRGGHSVRCVKD
jgi:uncharacterized protein (TIGR02145 family)